MIIPRKTSTQGNDHAGTRIYMVVAETRKDRHTDTRIGARTTRANYKEKGGMGKMSRGFCGNTSIHQPRQSAAGSGETLTLTSGQWLNMPYNVALGLLVHVHVGKVDLIKCCTARSSGSSWSCDSTVEMIMIRTWGASVKKE